MLHVKQQQQHTEMVARLLALLHDIERVFELQMPVLVVIDEAADGVVRAACKHARRCLLPLVGKARENYFMGGRLRAVAAKHLGLCHSCALGQKLYHAKKVQLHNDVALRLKAE